MPEKPYQPSVIRSIQRQNARDSEKLHRGLTEAMRKPWEPRTPFRMERIPGPNPRPEAMSQFRV